MSQVPAASSSSREPLPLCLPEDVAAGGPAPQPSGPAASARAPAPQPDAVRPFRDNDEARGWVGERLEEGYRTLLAQVPPGATLQYGLEATARVELAAELAGKVKVRHAPDGTYEVTVQSRLGLGGGLGAGAKKVDLLAGLKGEVTLRFASADEAADRLAALQQAGVRLSPLGQALSLAGALDADAPGRARAAADNVRAFELGTYGQLKTKLDALVGKLNLKAVGEPRVHVDLQRGTVAVELSQDVAAKLKGPGAKLGLPGASLEASLLPVAELERSDTLRLEVKLSPGELARLREGHLEVGALLAPERVEATLVQELTGELAGARVHARRALAVRDGQLPDGAQDLGSSRWEVHASLDARFGGEAKLETGVLDLKGELKLARPLFAEGGRTLALGEVQDAVLREVQEQQREDALVQAQLALSRPR